MHNDYASCTMGRVDGYGYDSQYKCTVCDVCRPCHSILSVLKPVFFAEFDRSVALTTRSDA